MKIKNLLLFGFILLSFSMFSQQSGEPTVVSTGVFLGKTIPLRDFPTVTNIEPEETSEAKIIQNRLRPNRKVNDNALPLNGDPLVQKNLGGIGTRALEENFDGATAAEGQATPPDPSGAAGPNHYVHGVNLVVKIFDKTGNLLAGPTFLGDFLGSGNNSGDPIIMYDHLADRYFVSQFGAATNSLVLGVSETPDPTGSYFVYEFALDAFPDYPHYSIWPDGYYFTANKFTGNTTYAVERDVILAGGANPQIVGFDLPGVVNNTNTVFSPEPANLTGINFPTDVPGYIVYLQDDGWAGITFDHLKVWEIDLDWDNIGNSTIGAPLEIPTQPFEATFAPFGTGDVEQPGTNQKIDMIGGVISFAANYRSFGSHNSWLITFNVDIDGNDTSGIRWVELRNDGVNDWSIFQEGTYAPADGHSRFMGSAAMDAAGNIGMGFNIASASLPVGIKYTGRFDGDPLGQMTLAEMTIVDGVGVQTFSNRFGDYSHLTMDPDNFTFWHTAEYFPSTDFWTTRIASFSLSGGFANDVGVNNIVNPMNGVLTNAETVDITIRNYGTDPQSNIPLELRLDGTLVANETFAGPLNPGESLPYTFIQTVDLSTAGDTYSIEAKTALAGDEFPGNDAFTKEVTHLLADDVGIIAITSPTTGEGLGLETITVTVKNFGANAQSNFDVQYVIDGNPAEVESFAGPIASEEEISFDFTVPGDFAALGTYDITARTNLSGDQEPSNDEVMITIEHEQCNPTANCTEGDGFQRFAMGTIDNVTGCSPDGYGDFTAISTDLEIDGTVTVTVQTGFANQIYSLWIDYNDNFVFEPSELVLSDVAVVNAGVDVTTTFNLPDDASLLGTHLVRARMGWTGTEPTSTDPCIDFTWGETEDYTATLVNEILAVGEEQFNDSELVVYPIDKVIYEVSLATNSDLGDVSYEVYNTLGQKLYSNEMERNEKGYISQVNFAGAAAGVYLVKVANSEFSNVKRVVFN